LEGGVHGKSKILDLKSRKCFCSLFSSLSCLKCDAIKMRTRKNLNLVLYTKCCITRMQFLYVKPDVLWIICLMNCFGLSKCGSIDSHRCREYVTSTYRIVMSGGYTCIELGGGRRKW
jgi:hypothetical protein